MESRGHRFLRGPQWLLIAIPLIDVTLAASHALSLRTAIFSGVVLELLLVGVFLAEVTVFRASYRIARRGGAGRGSSVLAGLDDTLPPPMAFVVRSEVGVGRALWWALRRRRVPMSDGHVISYTSRI